MARALINIELNFDELFVDFDGIATVANQNIIRIEDEDGRQEYIGRFEFRNNDIFGVVNTYQGFQAQALQFRVSEIDKDANRFFELLNSGDVERWLAFMFSANDTVSLSLGNDNVSGFDGNDNIRAGGGNDTVQGGSGNDTIIGGAGIDRLLGQAGNDFIRGGGGGDVLIGSRGADRIIGNGGADRINGGADNDTLAGGGGGDTLNGGGGADRIVGGKGDDLMNGGGGPDVFVFGGADGNDVIRGYTDGQDRIEITSGANNFAALTIEQAGGDALISFSNTVILLEGLNSSLLEADDFFF